MSWTDEEFAAAKMMQEQGMSSSEIGAQLGRTRNSVIGKLSRAGRTVANGYVDRRPSGSKKDKTKPKSNAFLVLNKKNKPIPKKFNCTEVTESEGVKLINLEAHHCRWPYGEKDFYFCGRQKFQGSYCVLHTVKATPQRETSNEGSNGANAFKRTQFRIGHSA